jgi:sugar O-acyltransferase (sialic acid O-acetyltransferase NeuD family)
MKVILLGAANPETGRMIAAIRKVDPEFTVLGFLDNDFRKKGIDFLGFPVLGGFEILENLVRDDVYFVNLITGSTRVRYETSYHMAQAGCKFTNFIHPSVDLTPATMGVGNYLQEGVLLQAEVTIGNNSSIHMGALIAHEVTIGDSVFVAHGCCISGCVRIGDGAFVGSNATILPRLQIGKWATVGAGAVVTKDVDDNSTVVGNPSRVVNVERGLYPDGNIFARKR